MKKLILLMLFCLMSKSALTQKVKDYFPLEVGNKWIYRAVSQFGGYSDSYITRFEVTGKELINDTLYYIADCSLFLPYYNMKYFRKDSVGNIYTRCDNQDRILFKVNADVNEIFASACNGRLAQWSIWSYSLSSQDFPFGKVTSIVIFSDQIIHKNYYTFSENHGCAIGMVSTEDVTYFLKRAINNGVITTPQVTKLNTVIFNTEFKNILFKTTAIMDTTTQIILESKKQGKRKGSLLRFKPTIDWDALNGPNYSIESDLDLSHGDDTIKITVPATVKDILGDGIDGNGNQIWEGSPVDDYVTTIIIPKLTRADNINEPLNYKLLQNYPNPFNPSTKISYSLDKSGFVTLKIYDVLGHEITTLVNEYQKPGNYEATFDANAANKLLSSGMYIYKLQVNNFIESKKIIFAK